MSFRHSLRTGTIFHNLAAHQCRRRQGKLKLAKQIRCRCAVNGIFHLHLPPGQKMGPFGGGAKGRGSPSMGQSSGDTSERGTAESDLPSLLEKYSSWWEINPGDWWAAQSFLHSLIHLF